MILLIKILEKHNFLKILQQMNSVKQSVIVQQQSCNQIYHIFQILIKMASNQEPPTKTQPTVKNTKEHINIPLIIPTIKIEPKQKLVGAKDLPKLALPYNGTIQEAANFYFSQYSRLYRQNLLLNNQLKYIIDSKNVLAEKYNQIKPNSETDEKKKRHRRTANEIPRNYICPYQNCQKSYGSDGSLTQHVKLKHPQFYQSGQYEQIVIERMRKGNDQNEQ